RQRSPTLRDTFGILHQALVDQHLRADVWRVLEDVLPAGEDWDRAKRLRLLLAEAIEHDDWSQAQIAKALRGAGEKADRLAELMPKGSDARKAVQQAIEQTNLEGVGS